MSMTAPGKRFGQICPKRPMAGPGRLTDEQRALAEDPEAVAMARLTARCRSRRWPAHLADDVESAALFALVGAARRYDPDDPIRY
jgi:hypothetical protein